MQCSIALCCPFSFINDYRIEYICVCVCVCVCVCARALVYVCVYVYESSPSVRVCSAKLMRTTRPPLTLLVILRYNENLIELPLED
jgi:hypothetical protein